VRLPDDVELTDDVVTLRRWAGDDADDLLAIWQDVELQRRFGVEPPVTAESIASYLEGVAERWDADLQVSLAVTIGGSLVGGCDLDHLDTPLPDLGYWTRADQRGRGLAPRAGALLLAWAGAELGVTDVTIEVEPDNRASIAVATRLGFARHQGVERTDGNRRLALYRQSRVGP
jgi:RimJ/RimL family protein N-acetyltransferase